MRQVDLQRCRCRSRRFPDSTRFVLHEAGRWERLSSRVADALPSFEAGVVRTGDDPRAERFVTVIAADVRPVICLRGEDDAAIPVGGGE